MASRSTPATTTTIIGGVDTHKHTHVAAACDHLGRILATASFPTTTTGYHQLHTWLASHGTLKRPRFDAAPV